MQYLYGANNHYHAGNETYTYNDTNTYHETIWDAAGSSDTIHYSGVIVSHIDLNPTSASFIGVPVYVQSNGVECRSTHPECMDR